MTTKKPFTEPKLQEELSLAAGTLGDVKQVVIRCVSGQRCDQA